MKDYANRNFRPQQNQLQQVPIRWGYIIAAFVAMIVIYSVWQHVVKKPIQKTAVVVRAQPIIKKQPVKFDFYQMLTKNQANGEVAGNPVNAPIKTHTATHYYVQVGSLESKAAAFQQKANLILTGVASPLIKIVRGSHGHYRVALGPYNNLMLATAQKTNLKHSKIKGLLVKSDDLKK